MSESVKVKDGYKQTEVGVIPEDWELYHAEDIGQFSKGKGISRKEAFSGTIPCIRYGEIYTKHQNLIKDFSPLVELTPQKMILHMKNGTTATTRHRVLLAFYRTHLKKEIPSVIEQYEPRLGVKVEYFGVKQMKTRWGTCNPDARRIWINLELAKKPPACLEYIVVHEMVHLLERSHNQRFTELMDEHLPLWRKYREELNRLPVRHELWNY